MQFEDLQVIWEEQEKAPIYAINQTAFDKMVRNQTKETKSLANLIEWTIIIGLITSGIITGSEPFQSGREYFQILEALLIFGIAGWVYLLRRTRLRKRVDSAYHLLRKPQHKRLDQSSARASGSLLCLQNISSLHQQGPRT